MNINEIMIAVGSLCVLSLIIGIVLSLAEKIFHVDINETEIAIREKLPGSNCGGCGYAGCDSLAQAIAKGDASVSACPVGGSSVAKEIAAIMGKEAEDVQKKVAYVKCDGTCDKRKDDYSYFGIDSCEFASRMPGSGPYSCNFGCLGFGSCAKVCDQRAIRIINRKAVVDDQLCIACGKCLKACPHGLIELIPAQSKYRVQCSSLSKGKDVKNACTAGCIGCGLCAKNCPSEAIIFQNNIAKIDYSKCTHCGLCAEKCPTKIIKDFI